MKIALICDIHSNYLALRGVLEDVKKQDVEKIFCLGDLVGYAPHPDKIFPILKDKKNNITVIMGNYDEATAFEKDDCGCGYTSLTSTAMGKISYSWTLQHTSKENKDWIKNLPKEIRLSVNNKKILMIHGSPDNISGRFDLLNDDQINNMMEKANIDILFCAHTHLPYHKIVNNKHVVNPGSVGRPRIGSPQASYAIIDLSDDCDVRFRLVDYDYKSFAKEIENSAMPKNNFAEIIRTGYWIF